MAENHTENRDNEKSLSVVNIEDAASESRKQAYEGSQLSNLKRKIDIRIIPPITLFFFLSFLDRSNIGNAKLENLTEDLKISSEGYLLCLTIFFIAYCIFEIPSNIILKKTTPRIWLPTLMLAWGIVMTLMGRVKSYGGLLGARFALGATEAGIFPGCIFYLSMWYPRNELLSRLTLFFVSTSLAGGFGGILAWAIGHMGGVSGQSGWVWIFVIEGCATVLVAFTGYFIIQPYLKDAQFLSEQEQAILLQRLSVGNDSLRKDEFTWSEVRETFKDIRIWLYTFVWMGIALPFYSLSLFLPTIIKNMRYSSARAQLLSVPPYAVAFVASLLVAVTVEKYSLSRSYAISFSATIGAIGFILLLSDLRPGVQYLGTIFATGGLYPAASIAYTWLASNVSGQVKRAVATAIQISIGDIGAIIGTQVYRSNQAPRYALGNGFSLGFIALTIVSSTVLRHILVRDNRLKARICQEPEDKSYVLKDDYRGDKDPRWRFFY